MERANSRPVCVQRASRVRPFHEIDDNRNCRTPRCLYMSGRDRSRTVSLLFYGFRRAVRKIRFRSDPRSRFVEIHEHGNEMPLLHRVFVSSRSSLPTWRRRIRVHVWNCSSVLSETRRESNFEYTSPYKKIGFLQPSPPGFQTIRVTTDATRSPRSFTAIPGVRDNGSAIKNEPFECKHATGNVLSRTITVRIYTRAFRLI